MPSSKNGATRELAPAPAEAPEQAPETAPVLSRSEQARAQAVETVDPKTRYKLAPALDGSEPKWHECADGEVAITRHVTGEGESAKVRDFVTYVPKAGARGRVVGIPLYALDAHPEIQI